MSHQRSSSRARIRRNSTPPSSPSSCDILMSCRPRFRGSPKQRRGASNHSRHRKRYKRSLSRSRSRSPPQSPRWNPVYRRDSRSPRQRREYTSHRSPRRGAFRRGSRDSFRRSRSRLGKPLRGWDQDSIQEAISPQRDHMQRDARNPSPFNQPSLRSPREAFGSNGLGSGEITPSSFVRAAPPAMHTQPKSTKFVSSIKLSEAVVSSLKSRRPPEAGTITEALAGGTHAIPPLDPLHTAVSQSMNPSANIRQPVPSENGMEIDECPRMSSSATKFGDAEVGLFKCCCAIITSRFVATQGPRFGLAPPLPPPSFHSVTSH